MKKSKKLSPSVFLFLLIAIFLLIGVLSKGFVGGLVLSVADNLQSAGSLAGFVDDSIADVERISQKSLTYHDLMVNLNSFVLKITGADVIEKEEETVVKLPNGYLAFTVSRMDDETINTYAANVTELYNHAKEKDIPFLYVMAPKKGYGMEFPAGTDNAILDNCQRFLARLDEGQVPYLNLMEALEQAGLTQEDMFFVTDHHWKPSTAMIAAGEICRDLSTRYGFTYSPSVFELSNYNVKTYPKWFLGSQGKMTGLYYTDIGADDFDILTPKFETSLTMEKPFENETLTGSFEETLIFKRHVEKRDYYDMNPYGAYGGGDFHIQIVKNHQNSDGPKVVLVRDSMAGAMAPFLSLSFGELHILDLREYDYMAGERVPSVSAYIDEIGADYVIVMYNAVPNEDILFTFETGR